MHGKKNTGFIDPAFMPPRRVSSFLRLRASESLACDAQKPGDWSGDCHHAHQVHHFERHVLHLHSHQLKISQICLWALGLCLRIGVCVFIPNSSCFFAIKSTPHMCKSTPHLFETIPRLSAGRRSSGSRPTLNPIGLNEGLRSRACEHLPLVQKRPVI